MVKLTVRLDDADKEVLEDLSAKEGVSMNEYLRRVIRKEAEAQLRDPEIWDCLK